MAKDSGGMLLLLGAAGVGVYGYMNGWFAQWGLGPAATPLVGAPAGTIPVSAAQAAALGLPVGTSFITQAQWAALSSGSAAAGSGLPANAGTATTAVPSMGTTVTNATDALAQVAARDAYILPDPATFATLSASLPANYGTVITTDKGGVLLRPDVYAAVEALITNRLTRAAAGGAAASSLQAAGQTTLSEIQQTMSSSGLTGFGDYRRYVFSRSGRYL